MSAAPHPPPLPPRLLPLPPPRLLPLLLLLPVLLLAAACGGEAHPAAAAGPEVPEFALLDQHGRFHQLGEYGDRRAVVLFVHGVGCPIVRQSLPALAELRRRFEPQGVAFLMLNANPQDDRDAVAAETRQYEQPIPVLLDRAQLVAATLGIDRTAEALVIDPASQRLIWRGAVDDRLRYETQGAQASREQLAEALAAWLDGEPVPPAEAPLRGCAIAFPRRTGPPPDYAAEVAPILRARCGSCHAPGGIAPWAMTDHATVAGWSAMMREVLLTRRMPPFGADTWLTALRHDGSLPDDEAAALAAWIDAGAPRGDGPDPLVSDPVAPPPPWPLGEPDLVLAIPEQSLPATGEIPYRDVVVPLSPGRDLWIRGVHVRPGNPQVLHHALVFVNHPDDSRDERQLDRRWTTQVFGAWAPGFGATEYPADAGHFIPAGSTLEVQLHYTPTGRPETDASHLGLYLSEQPPLRQYRIRGLIDTTLNIPPGARGHVVVGSQFVPQDVLVHAFFPHMHHRGRSMRYEAHLPDGTVETLLSVPRFRFNWQFSYQLAEPRRLPAGSTIIARCVYDNSRWNADNPDPTQRVRFGKQTDDEMLLCYVMYTLVEPDVEAEVEAEVEVEVEAEVEAGVATESGDSH